MAYRQLLCLISVGWCVDVQVQAVLRDAQGDLLPCGSKGIRDSLSYQWILQAPCRDQAEGSSGSEPPAELVAYSCLRTLETSSKPVVPSFSNLVRPPLA